MKTYSQNYTKIEEAEELLYSATRLMANDCNDAALERIDFARNLLHEYTNGTNLVEDDDVADGLVKRSDAEAAVAEANEHRLVEKQAIEYLCNISEELEAESSLTIERPYGIDCDVIITVKKR